VCETDSTVKIGLVAVQIDTVVFVRISMSVWNRQYGKYWVGDSADCYSDVGVGKCECLELTVR
jgi:hypothetical protein